MTVRNLEHAFAPRSVAVIGASAEPRSVGNKLTENVMAGSFAGEIYLVNPHQESSAARRCFPDIVALPVVPILRSFSHLDLLHQLPKISLRAKRRA